MNSTYYNGDIPFIRSGDIHSHKTELLISQEGIDNSSAKLVEKGNILYALYGATSGEVSISKLNGAINQAILAIIPNANNNPELIMQYLKNKKIDIVNTYLQGGQGNLSASIIQNLIITIPKTLEEQTQIGNFFKQLDETIALHKRKLKKFITLKRSFLNAIFCSKNILFNNKNTFSWEQRKLGDVVEFYSGLTYSPNHVSKQGTLVLRSSNVNENQIVTNDSVFVCSHIVNSTNVEIGDIIVVVRNGSRNLIGKHAKIQKVMPNTVIGAFMTGVRYKHSDFLIALLDTQLFSKEIEKNLGATINQITTSSFKNMDFHIPNEKEQTQIGNFFKQIDETIALHKRKLKKFITLKRSFLNAIFCSKNILFNNKNTFSWEQRKLGEIVKITMGQSPQSQNYTDNPNDHILVQGNADMKNGFVFPRVWTTQVTKTANKNDLILSVRAPVGDVGKTNYDVVLGRGVAAIRGNEFVYQTLLKMKLNHLWENLSSGSTFDSINSNDIKNVLIIFPSNEEQTQIGNFFKQLDETIALHKRKTMIVWCNDASLF